MAGEFEVIGEDQLRILGAKLKVADRAMRLQLSRNFRVATKPIIAKQRAAARDRLPHTGGLNEIVAKSQIGTRSSLTGRSVGVTIVARNRDNIRNIDGGMVRHPTYGRPPWVNQAVPEGWFTEPAEESATELRAAASEAIAHTLKELG